MKLVLWIAEIRYLISILQSPPSSLFMIIGLSVRETIGACVCAFIYALVSKRPRRIEVRCTLLSSCRNHSAWYLHRLEHSTGSSVAQETACAASLKMMTTKLGMLAFVCSYLQCLAKSAKICWRQCKKNLFLGILSDTFFCWSHPYSRWASSYQVDRRSKFHLTEREYSIDSYCITRGML